MKSAPLPFSLRQLQYALAVRRTRSFRRAALECGVSQPSLSAQLAELEAGLGIQLFERNRKRVMETVPGSVLLGRAEQVLLKAQDLVDSAHENLDPLARQLRLGVIPTVGPYLLADLDPALRHAFPRLDLRWTEDKTEVLVARVQRGELDGALLALEANLEDLQHSFVGKDPFVLAISPEHPLASGKRSVALEELHNERMLLLDDGHCFRDQALAFCTQAGTRELGFRATSLATLAQMTAGGAALTLLPKISLNVENRRGTLVIRQLREPVPARTIVLAWRKGSSLHLALTRVASEMRRTFADLPELA
ncbi:MAG: LysR substrate-binding domain-containing protein [Polyangiaceae bacterium]|nr:LysR substrate-binding domain-containing protein [Polyangiaceae bacterium]